MNKKWKLTNTRSQRALKETEHNTVLSDFWVSYFFYLYYRNPVLELRRKPLTLSFESFSLLWSRQRKDLLRLRLSLSPRLLNRRKSCCIVCSLKKEHRPSPLQIPEQTFLRILIAFFPVKAFSTPLWPFFPDRFLSLQPVIYDNERRKHPVVWETKFSW